MLILVLAATPYADFPAASSIVARDRFLPRESEPATARVPNAADPERPRGVSPGGVAATRTRSPDLQIGVSSVHAVAGGHGDTRAKDPNAAGGRCAIKASGPGHGVVLVIVATTKAFEGAWSSAS